jgi:hypothetical protein
LIPAFSSRSWNVLHDGHDQVRHVNRFADATDGHQWIHVDVKRARCPHPQPGSSRAGPDSRHGDMAARRASGGG